MSDEVKAPDTFRICKKCGESKVRNPSGKFPNGRDTRFVNEKDRTWNGLVCVECQGKKMGAHMKAKRNKDVQ
jgi:hypothetical protein